MNELNNVRKVRKNNYKEKKECEVEIFKKYKEILK